MTHVPVAGPGVAPADVTTPAERLDEPLVVRWIGSSEIQLRDVSLPAAVAARLREVGDRPVVFQADAGIGRMAPEVAAGVRAAAASGADALVVSLNLVWLHWDGVGCDGVEPPHARYACLLTPVSPAVTAARAAELRDLLATIADTGLPAFVYTQPLSTTALDDPALGEPVATAEAAMAGFDPRLERIAFVADSFTRRMAPTREGIEFHDMVHPTPAGAEALAAWLAPELEAFWQRAGVAG